MSKETQEQDDRPIQGVIFDLDGTLLDTLPDITRVMNGVLYNNNFPLRSGQECKSFVGRGLKNALLQSLPDRYHPNEKELETMMADLLEIYRKDPTSGTTPYPGIVKLLDELTSRNIPMAILSNKDHELVVRIVDEIISQYRFVRVEGLSTRYLRKPDPTLLKEIISDMGLGADQVLFVGDSEVDAETARLAGVRYAIVSYGFRSYNDLQGSGISQDELFRSVKELARYIQKRLPQES